MKGPTPNLTHLLNKVQALIACKAGTEKELVTFLQRRQPQVNGWLKRRIEPGGEITIQLKNWVTLKEAEIEASDDAAQDQRFRVEFRRLSKEYPAE